MNLEHVDCLPNTGAPGALFWGAALGLLLVILGAYVLASASRSRSEAGAVVLHALAALALALPVAAALLVALSGGATAAGGQCGRADRAHGWSTPAADPTSGRPSVSPPSSRPTATLSPSPSSSPTSVPPVCPTDNDVSTLPAGHHLVWTPVPAADQLPASGGPGDYAVVYPDGISGYTWSIEDADGATSGACPGMPVDPACVPFPTSVTADYYYWEDPTGWVYYGSGTSGGCRGGGNNGGGHNGGGGNNGHEGGGNNGGGGNG